MKKRILKSLTVAIVVIAMLSGNVFAAFPDVNSTKYSWAVESINSMADAGIIKGYEDGTFMPEKSVTKLEGLVLVSRILGFEDEANAVIVDEATQIFSEVIDSYNVNFGEKELAYLLLKGVLTPNELDDYLTGGGASDGLKRYEIATLLTKALDGDVGLATSPSLSYSDTSDIPASAKKYVKYVTDKGLMNGMEDNKFSPNTNVTRAQAAVVLKKLQVLTSYQFRAGTVTDMNNQTGIIKVKSEDGSVYTHSIMQNVLLRNEGKVISAKEITVGSLAAITYKDASLYAIDFVASEADSKVTGVISSVTTGTNSTISVKVFEENATEPSDEKTTYVMANDVAIIYNGEAATKTSLTNGKLAVIDVKGGKAKTITVYDKSSVVSGTIEDIKISPLFKLVVKDNDGNVNEYLLKDVVTVTRGGKTASVTDLTKGDIVSLTLDYGIISKIVATTKTNVKSGVITAIYISSSPELTLDIDGEEETYPLSVNTKYSIIGVESPSIYSLRTNSAVTVDIESDTIVKVTATASTETKTFTGNVVSVTPAAKVFQVSFTDPALGITETDTVVVGDKTTIIDTNGKTKKLSDVKIGDSVTVYGSISSGVITAITVMVVD